MEQLSLRKSLRKKGAIVTFILWFCFVLFDFGFTKEFTGFISFIALFIAGFFYLVYFIAAVPVIVKIKELKPEKEQLQVARNTDQKDTAAVKIKKRGFWIGFFLGLIPFSVSIVLSFFQFWDAFSRPDIYGKPHFPNDTYLPLIYGLAFAVTLTLIGSMIGWAIGKIRSRN